MLKPEPIDYSKVTSWNKPGLLRKQAAYIEHQAERIAFLEKVAEQAIKVGDIARWGVLVSSPDRDEYAWEAPELFHHLQEMQEKNATGMADTLSQLSEGDTN